MSKADQIREFIGRLPPGSKIHLSKRPISSMSSKSSQGKGFKPDGFWYDCDGEWIGWMSSEAPHWIDDLAYIYSVKVKKGGMLVLSSASDILDFTNKYAVDKWQIDWGMVARKYKGIEICPYNWNMRMNPATMWYYPWDVASGCVWDSSALSIEMIGKWEDDQIIPKNEIVASEMVRVAESLMKGLLFVPIGVVKDRDKVEKAIRKIERSFSEESITRPEWQILRTMLSNAVEESGQNVMEGIHEIVESKGMWMPTGMTKWDVPNDLWRVGAFVKKINRYNGIGKKELSEWGDGWIRIYMAMNRLKREMMVSGR